MKTPRVTAPQPEVAINPVRSPAIVKALRLLLGILRRHGLTRVGTRNLVDGSPVALGMVSVGHDYRKVVLGEVSLDVDLEVLATESGATFMAISVAEMKVDSLKDGEWAGSIGITFRSFSGSLDAVMLAWQEAKSKAEAFSAENGLNFNYNPFQ